MYFNTAVTLQAYLLRQKMEKQQEKRKVAKKTQQSVAPEGAEEWPAREGGMMSVKILTVTQSGSHGWR